MGTNNRKEVLLMLCFFLGFVIGVCVGILMMCMLFVSKDDN